MAGFAYQRGFGNTFESEAISGALPVGQNNPQECPFGLYCEQLSGTAFTVPRAHNLRSWLYRIHPSVQHSEMVPSTISSGFGLSKGENEGDYHMDPNQMRWQPRKIPPTEKPTNFLEGMTPVGRAGSPGSKSGLAIYTYVMNKSMEASCITNADGDLLIVPQLGTLTVQTEFGFMEVEPNEICVIQRGMRFRIACSTEQNRGYVLEIFQGHFQLPDLGPIGANGLANPFDFESPVAAYEDDDSTWLCFTKFGGRLFEMKQSFSPFNVVAFRGNYVPYKYDLRKFCAVNSVTYDHCDPSIFTVLTCPTNTLGVAVADFVVFPPRWMVAEHTFRPPWFHRNTMTEYMGLIWGGYDAKEGGFVPGGASLHSCMSPHGPDSVTFERMSDPSKTNTTEPAFFGNGLAFMFETTFLLELSSEAIGSTNRELNYQKCWEKMPKNFNPKHKKRVQVACTDHLLAWRQEEEKQQGKERTSKKQKR